MSIFLHFPSKFARMPPRATLNYNNSITNGLVSGVIVDPQQGLSQRELFTGELPTNSPYAGTTLTSTPYGIGYKTAGASTSDEGLQYTIQDRIPQGSSSRTCVAIMRRTENETRNCLLSYGADTSYQRWTWRLDTTNNLRIEIDAAGDTTALTVPANTLSMSAIVFDESISVNLTGQVMYLGANGVLSSETLTGGNTLNTGNSGELVWWGDWLATEPKEGSKSDLFWCGMWDRALSHAELLALHQNPWQILKPRKQITYSFGSTWTTPQKIAIRKRNRGRARPPRFSTVRRDDIHSVWEKDLFFGFVTPPHLGDVSASTADTIYSIDREGSESTTNPITIAGEPQIGPVLANDTDGGNKGIHFGGVKNKDGISEMTFLCCLTYPANPTTSSVAIKYDGQNGAAQLTIVNSSTELQARVRGDASYANSWEGGHLYNHWHVWGVAWGNDVFRQYRNGQQNTFQPTRATAGTLSVTTADHYLMRDYASSTGTWGRMAYAFYWTREFEKSEFVALNNDFWSFLKPDLRTVYSFPSNKPATPTPHGWLQG